MSLFFEYFFTTNLQHYEIKAEMLIFGLILIRFEVKPFLKF